MRIFVTGATGVLGRRVVRRLVADGVEVSGVAGTSQKGFWLRSHGVTPVSVSLFDREALSTAVAGHDVVANLATAVPTGPRAALRSAWHDSHQLRRDGSRNLVDAALRAGAERYLQESLALLYADGGDDDLDESAAVAPTWITEPALVAEDEAARFAEHGGVAVALRFGAFYGHDSAHSIETIEAAEAGQFAVPGPRDAFWPSVTTDDAAAAVVAALRAPAGLYNVADERPLRRVEHAEALAGALGVGPLKLAPVGPGFSEDFAMMLRSQRVTSRRFADATGWRPHQPSAWEGWRFVVDHLPQRRVA
jgi:nucleoside-diphosphate-sugar epimerase